MIVTYAGRDAVDAAAPARMMIAGRFSVSGQSARRRTALMRTAKSCGPDASTPASSLAEVREPNRADVPISARRRWQKSPVTGEQLC